MCVSTIHAPYGAIHSECSINPYGLFDTRFVDGHDMFDYENRKDRGKGLPRFFIVYIYAVLFGTAL